MRVGSDKIIDVDIRIIAATNRDLEEETRRGNFRSDLFYRLSVLPLTLEPLRRRKDDILPLLANFLGKAYRRVTEEEKSRLLSYDWPGNIRELESAAIYYKTLSCFPPHLMDSACPCDPAIDGEPATYSKVTGYRKSACRREPTCHLEAAGRPEPACFNDPQAFSLTPRAAEAAPNRRWEAMTPALNEEWENIVLLAIQTIARHSQAYQGIGRMALLQRLREQGVSIGDSRLRHLLSDLQNKGLILTRTGRRGSQLTEAGAAWLKRRLPG